MDLGGNQQIIYFNEVNPGSPGQVGSNLYHFAPGIKLRLTPAGQIGTGCPLFVTEKPDSLYWFDP